MEDRKDNPPEENAKLDTNGMCRGRSSILHVEKDDNTNSGLRSTQSEQYTGDVSSDLVELSSDDEVQINVKRKSSEKNLQADDQCSSGRTSPEDETCSICLSEYENKAHLDKCCHAFCYFCILQWSEIVRTCPLCKSSFTSIIHSVKSMDNYQQHFLSKSDGRGFRYRTILTERHRQQQQQQMQSQRHQWNETSIRGQLARRRATRAAAQRDRNTRSFERRRTIYRNNLRVQRVTQTGPPKQRDISLEFLRSNPACTHRLVRWLARDLRALLNDEESRASSVLENIWPLINKVELGSEEFSSQLHPFLGDKTEHFIYEFLSFARSPFFEITDYDEHAQYSWPSESEQEPRGCHTPVPGPSGETLSRTHLNRDSPALQTANNTWCPSSSPGISGLNGGAGLKRSATISSSNSSVSPVLDIPRQFARRKEGSGSPSKSGLQLLSKGKGVFQGDKRSRSHSSKSSERRRRDDIQRLSPSRKSGKHSQEKTRKSPLSPSQTHCKRKTRDENIDRRRTKVYGQSSSRSESSSRNSRSRHSRSPKSRTRDSRSRESRSRLMSNDPLSTSGCHTPVPGPSGETLSRTHLNRDSPALQTADNTWCPSSSPGISGLNGGAGLKRSATISSSNSSVSPVLDIPRQFARRKEGSGSPSKSGLQLLSKGKGVFQGDKRSRSHSSKSSKGRWRDDIQRLSPSRKSGKHSQEKTRKSPLSPSQTHCKRKTRDEKIDRRRTKEYGQSSSRSESSSRNSRSRHSRSPKSRTRDSRSRESRSRLMFSGPLSTSGRHTPVPGPSGETLSPTDWNRDSPVCQTVNNEWSSSSSPGISGLNGGAGLKRTVNISSSNSSVTPLTTLVDIVPTINYQASNASCDSIGRSKRKRSSNETVVEKTQVEAEKNHQYHHDHGNSHKHKHRRIESSEKRDSG